MLENLIQLVKENAGDAIINNPAVPNEKNDAAIESTAGSIFDSLKSQFVSGGGADLISSFFSGTQNEGSGPLASGIAEKATAGLVKKIGLPEGTAAGIVSQLLPQVMSSLKSKTNDPADKSFDLQGIIGSLAGGQSDGIINKVKGMFGM